jgi:hypothetical protein
VSGTLHRCRDGWAPPIRRLAGPRCELSVNQARLGRHELDALRVGVARPAPEQPLALVDHGVDLPLRQPLERLDQQPGRAGPFDRRASVSTRSRSRANGVPEKLRVRTFCITGRSATPSRAVAGGVTASGARAARGSTPVGRAPRHAGSARAARLTQGATLDPRGERSSVGRAPGCGPGGRRFESGRSPSKKATLTRRFCAVWAVGHDRGRASIGHQSHAQKGA